LNLLRLFRRNIVQLDFGHQPIKQADELTRAECWSPQTFLTVPLKRQPPATVLHRITVEDPAIRFADRVNQWIVLMQRARTQNQVKGVPLKERQRLLG
jgi:hypothetical protein